MNLMRGSNRLSVALLVVAAALFAAASGVFVRDFGAGMRSAVNTSADPGGGYEERINLYELTYDIALFTTVEVRLTVRESYGSVLLDTRSNGSYLASFRPRLPGLHHIVILNVANSTGQIGYTLLLSNDVPPELETSLLDPLLYASAGLLVSSVLLSLIPKVARRQSEGGRDS